MAAKKLTAWWDRKSDPDRIELYTRWTFNFFALLEVVVGFSLAVAVEPRWGIAVVCLLVVAHAALCQITSSRCLDWMLDRRDRPTAMMWTNAAGAAVIVGVLLAFESADMTRELTGVTTLSSVVMIMAAMSLSLNLRPSEFGRLVLAATPIVAGMALLAGSPARLVTVYAAMTLWCGLAGGFAGRASGWILAAVMELDEARHAQARLAVAEERLRFGRDLHDVLGRNLSVIALKSELAVQLAQRKGAASGAALDQMVEVQRIARESQSELREVVRGYRDTSLLNELAGARGVLRAAGIECEIDADPNTALPESVRAALGWVVREGATNVLRHSDASRCVIRLRLTEHPDAAVLTLVNDGVRDVKAARSIGSSGNGRSAGLIGLRERLSALRGTLSTPDPAEPTGDGRSWSHGVWDDRLPPDDEVFVLRAEIPVSADASSEDGRGGFGERGNGAGGGTSAGGGNEAGGGNGAGGGSSAADTAVGGAYGTKAGRAGTDGR
ncbi:histidine kinase [Streptomyces sp. XM4193]|uniref:sensor histidine kinase n=1 Tax=Streptomyces sp. XM4193 TaxID=2929782 RepID=UPI001FF8B012|nr:histidine kinase [Streptomyces sp. XM4193]MCK1794965.1 histidine kinase [Streptomyces sp. XM4193]